MKNLLGIMIAIGAVGCQVEGPSSTEASESTTEQAATNGDLCSGIPNYCGAPLPQMLLWSGLPSSTSTTVALIDSKAVQGWLRIYGVDPVKGAVLWGRWATVGNQGGSVMQSVVTLPSGYLDYVRPPPCGEGCPVGDGAIGENMLELARLKLGIVPISNDLTAACYH